MANCSICKKEILPGDKVATYSNESWGIVKECDNGLYIEEKGKSIYGLLKYLSLWVCAECSHLKETSYGEVRFTDEEVK